MSRTIVALILLIGASVALVQSAWPQTESPADEDLSSLPLPELCEFRSDPAVWAEIKRRDLFSRRTVKAIREERVVTGMDQDAVFCLLGEPTAVINVKADRGQDLVDAFVFPVEDEFLIVHVRHREKRQESTVVRSYASDTGIVTGYIRDWVPTPWTRYGESSIYGDGWTR